MYFNENKEDTNIDKEFNTKKGTDFSKLKLPLIILGVIILIGIIVFAIISLQKNKTKYYIILDGSEEMTIYQGSSYNEPGYRGYDSNKKSLEVTVSGEVDTSKVGTYTLIYTLHNEKKTRTVNVIEKPENPTIIHLNGSKDITIKVGEQYEEPGYNAIDYIDGDLTDKVTISGKVDTSKKGVYRLVYTVVNSSGVTTSEERIVTVE